LSHASLSISLLKRINVPYSCRLHFPFTTGYRSPLSPSPTFGY
jgi:hypothetical protein